MLTAAASLTALVAVVAVVVVSASVWHRPPRRLHDPDAASPAALLIL
jgi:hypothetical protein